jgi:hypothetical protein
LIGEFGSFPASLMSSTPSFRLIEQPMAFRRPRTS